MTFSKNVASTLAKLVRRPLSQAIVLLMGIYTALWGFWVGNPFWTVFNLSTLYSALATVAPEWFWGGLAVFCGLATIYGALRKSVRSLELGALLGFLHWLVLATLYFVGDWQSTGGITSLFISIYFAYVYLNVKIRRKERNLYDYSILDD